MSNFDYDLRAINMYRKVHQAGSAFFDQGDEWLVLGRFDTLEIQNLTSSDSLFEAIWKDISQKSVCSDSPGAHIYRHPTYLFSQKDSKHTTFWKNDSAPFMFVTRIHAKSCYSEDGHEAYLEQLESQIEASLKDFSTEDFFFSKTLGLSDLILLVKSNSVPKLLKGIQELSRQSYVGDVYSYCCISKWAMKSNGTSPAVAREDSIPLVSLRFAVRDAEAVMEQIEKWKKLELDGKRVKDVFYVTGTEDVNVLLEDISSAVLIKFLNEIIEGGGRILWNTFDDMTTRIGVSADEDIKDDFREDEAPINDSAHVDSVRAPVPGTGGADVGRLQETFLKLQQELLNLIPDGEGADWTRSLQEIVNALVNVSDNCVLDQLCYILLDGLQGLLRKLRNVDELYIKKNAAHCYKFVSGIAYLKEQIIRMESQLVHHPETRPMIFNIPATVMEIDLAFISMCADYFQLKEPKKNNFYFVLVPCLCKTISIHNLLYQEGPDHLLYVEMPLSCCYKPRFVACALAHEIAHFSGEGTRMRTERSVALFYSCAFMLAQLLDVSHSRVAIVELMNGLLEDYKKNAKTTKYMTVLEGKLAEACRNVVRDRELIRRLHMSASANLCNGESQLSWLSRKQAEYNAILELGNVQTVIDNMKEVDMLSQECYADVAMIHLLGINAQTYFDLIWQNYIMKDRYEGKDIQKALIIERVSLVFLVLFPDYDPAEIENAIFDHGAKSLFGVMMCHFDEFKNGTFDLAKVCETVGIEIQDNKSPFHPYQVLSALYLYLKECCSEMKRIDAMYPDEKKNVNKFYETIENDSQFMSKTQLEAIFRFRNSLLEK